MRIAALSLTLLACLVAALAAGLVPAAPARATGIGPAPILLGKVADLRDIVMVDGSPVLRAGAGDYQILLLPDGKLALAPMPAAHEPIAPAPPEIIPHAAIVHGSNDIKAAWFAAPTGRYGHGVLGDRIEAAALKVETADGKILSHRLSDDSVFEDLTPRLADLDGDGRDEIIAVHSYQDSGAAVSLFGIRDGALVRLSESAPVGLPHRWLNPVGAADFDGDGRAEIAIVRTPHIGGILILYRWQGDKLEEIGRATGYSSHAMGSTVLGMSAMLDLDGDRAPEIILPDQGRAGLRAVSYAGGAFRTLWSVSNDAPIATSILTVPLDGHGGADILYGLADGSVMLLPR